MEEKNNNEVVIKTDETKKKGKSGIAIASMILGIVGILGSWIPVLNITSCINAIIGFCLALVAILISRKKAKKVEGTAVTGIVLSILTIFIAATVNLTVMQFANSIFNNIVEDMTKKIYEEMDIDVTDEAFDKLDN